MMKSLAKAVISISFILVVSCRWTSSDIQDGAATCRWQVMELPIFENGSPLGREDIPTASKDIWNYCLVPENQKNVEEIYESKLFQHLLKR